jgi:hypothetical protein
MYVSSDGPYDSLSDLVFTSQNLTGCFICCSAFVKAPAVPLERYVLALIVDAQYKPQQTVWFTTVSSNCKQSHRLTPHHLERSNKDRQSIPRARQKKLHRFLSTKSVPRVIHVPLALVLLERRLRFKCTTKRYC